MTREPSPKDRPRRRGPAVVLTLSLLLGSCSTAAPAASPSASHDAATSPAPKPATAATTTPGPVDTDAVQRDLDALFVAGLAGDRSGWDARTSSTDPGFRARSTLLFDNLSRLPVERLRVRLTGTQAALPAERQAVLGPDARVLQARVTWRLPHERADATSTVWLTVLPTSTGHVLAGTADGTALDAPAQPLWWLEPTTAASRGRATALVGPGQDADRWAGLAARAASDARRDLPPDAADGWDGRVVVQVPGDTADFARVLGAAPSAYAGTAAVTRPEGPTTDAAPRVVVNPAAADGSTDELGLLLTHETVHVATRSAASPAPLWAVEGLAEQVALRAHPRQRADELAALRRLDVDDLPPALPSDAAFGAGAEDVTAAYAQAWLACAAVARRSGERGLGRLYAALDDGRTLDEAARATLGVDGTTLARWALDERRRAGVPG